jgi:steroid 5-alpha reductase family enzyme
MIVLHLEAPAGAGIPPLEQQMLRSCGERYRDYQSRTSMFFPLPSQKGVVI